MMINISIKIHQYIKHLFSQQPNGIYLDLGAGSGGQESISYLLYKELFWRGLCTEKDSKLFEYLGKSRDHLNLYGALSSSENILIKNTNGEKLPYFTLDTIQTLLTAPIDFCNLQQYDLDVIINGDQFFQWNVSVISILNIQQLHLIYTIFKKREYTYINRIGGFDFFIKNTVL
ncbi:MAG: hypothetical protein LBV59_21390 [Sphingobacterium sp.]|jgi:hypothetical protein|uniref:hypothetical protein n=1 Tax=Sphingobacterium sp. TaxID=341027 RepID=UPI00284F679E|nr:hypothetical protein [Sphingobacterium sp.]MDR3010499.1 hypothetical protein [Sphingobacterium sp.]